MSDSAADPPDPASCYPPVPGLENQESQQLDPDLFLSVGGDARGRFAQGCFGNKRGRPPCIPNPRRRLVDFAHRPPSPRALSDLLDRKSYLLRRLAQQLLPPARATVGPVARIVAVAPAKVQKRRLENRGGTSDAG